MFSTVLSSAVTGIESRLVCVEADVCNGMPSFEMVGLLAGEVKEARERVRAALRNSGIILPPKRITVNLSPADLRKSGAVFDLPIAAALLAAAGLIDKEALKETLIAGELSLNGTVRPVNGILAMAAGAAGYGCKRFLLPEENAGEASVIGNLEIRGIKSITHLLDIFGGRGNELENNINIEETASAPPEYDVDFSEVNGQKPAKRAAEIACAGMHNLLLIGPPGSGKTMLAKRIPTILPPLTLEESIEVTKIYSVSGNLKPGCSLLQNRLFRSPHHTITRTALIGGGSRIRPGEISLAHRGVLFLDELPEFQRSVLESIRQPLEDKQVHIARSAVSCTFPSDFMLVGAMNPCRCGYYPDLSRCSCSGKQVEQYLGRISRPLLDRIDLCVELPRAAYKELSSGGREESSAVIRERVIRAHHIQKERYRNVPVLCNADLSGNQIRQYCHMTGETDRFMEKLFGSMSLSARMYGKILKVARTIADLEGSRKIEKQHISEAVCYRAMDEKYWGK